MGSEFEYTRRKLIERVIKHANKELPLKEALLLSNFLSQYYLSVSSDVLNARSVLDLYGAVVSYWNFIVKRLPHQIKIRAYNPNQKEHGWKSIYTIIEIACQEMPFLIDSVRLALVREELSIHTIIHMGGMRFIRNTAGLIDTVLPLDVLEGNIEIKSGDVFVKESPIYIEIEKQIDRNVLQRIENKILIILQDVQVIVEDWQHMKKQVSDCLNTLEKQTDSISKVELYETKAFLRWLLDDHFTFLGVAKYRFLGKGDKGSLNYIKNTGFGMLGIFKTRIKKRELSQMSSVAKKAYLSRQMLLLGKTNTLSTVHRPVYTDFISVKFFSETGLLMQEWRFIGLYTSAAYNSTPKSIPLLREKIQIILNISGFSKTSHENKALLNILETLPRDELFHTSQQELYYLAVGVLHLHERQKIRLFIRRDTYGRFFSCLVFVPREILNSEFRHKMENILSEALNGYAVVFSTRFSESILARIHFLVRVDPLKEINYIFGKIEEKLIDAGRTWKDYLHNTLCSFFGEKKGTELLRQYGDAFPAGYRETFTARTAVVDIEYIETLHGGGKNTLAMSLYRPIEDSEGSFRFKLFRLAKPFPLSDVVPMLENMGLRIISERPYQIRRKGDGIVWINDYHMLQSSTQTLSLKDIKETFQDAFAAIWQGRVENDGFNRLVLSARFSWRQISILRAYYAYLWQAGFGFSKSVVEDALNVNSRLTIKLSQLFTSRFDPNIKYTVKRLDELATKIKNELDSVISFNEDRIIRCFFEAILATLRTNFFQTEEDGSYKSYLSLKFESAKMPELPLPLPLYEIFVYSPRVEGIHLRVARVARGGLRWSDRHEDFRTEILSLMKAQQVKNSVIVPLGAKGGFIVKNLETNATKEPSFQEVTDCYRMFIRGLLDITDNRQVNKIVPPPNVIRYDGDDPYLVVAADKGTATLSDIANEISKEYNFWLRDAFASGGSTGYDHKKIGITARGAWESVKIHFQRFRHDIQTTPFTVIGIGDMSGDVFGNGMLLSSAIKLVAAFNHMHIFLDPDPDPATSFQERKRLFNMTRSSWIDYDKKLLSKGGGIYARSEKFIRITFQVKKMLGVCKDKLLPNDLIRAILRAPADLLWNAGIGTFVKALTEKHAEVSDRANDSIRINGNDLLVKVVVEGGNLGLTQLARVEYSKKGGIINTDAIDNSAGVNCSDNEVNIKVLLNDAVDSGIVTENERNQLLAGMCEEVAEIVLLNNRRQNEAINITELQAPGNIEMHSRLICKLERTVNLDRKVEYLPDKVEILNRKIHKKGLTRPEIAVLIAYAKIALKKELIWSAVLDDPYVHRELESAFPKPLRKQFKCFMKQHYLKREIIVTQVSNFVIDEMGMNFISRIHDETGSSTPEIVRAYMVSKLVFEADEIRVGITQLRTTVAPNIQLKMLQELNRLIRRSTRWLLKNRWSGVNISDSIYYFAPRVKEIQNVLFNLIKGSEFNFLKKEFKKLMKAGVPEKLAQRIAGMPSMFSALDMVEAASFEKRTVLEVAQVYFSIGAKLELGWFRELIKNKFVNNHWEALARATFRDDVDRQQRNLAIAILQSEGSLDKNVTVHVENWIQYHQKLLNRWQYFISEFKASSPEFTMFAVAIRELLDLSHTLYYSKGL